MLLSPLWGMVLTFVSKPVIDTTWDYGVSGTGIKLLYIVSLVVPALMLPRILGTDFRVRQRRSAQLIAVVYLVSQVFGSHALLVHGDYMSFAEVWLRALNGYVGFFLFVYCCRETRTLRILLLAIIIAGLFPLAMGLYQNLAGVGLRESQTVGLVRKIGVYHDAVSFRFYGFQSIAAVILFLSYFRSSRKTVDYALLGYMAAWTYVLYFIYSKAAVMTGILWFLTWPLLTRRYRYLLGGLVVGIVLVATSLAVRPLDELQQLFSKEIAFQSGEAHDARRMLAGRGFIWESSMDDWWSLPFITKLAGDGEMRPVHNEFLRVLFMSGLVGLCCHVCVICAIAWILGRRAIRNRSALDIGALMVFEMYLVDCIGLHPGWYPSYQWFVWGIIGMALQSGYGQRWQVCPRTLSNMMTIASDRACFGSVVTPGGGRPPVRCDGLT